VITADTITDEQVKSVWALGGNLITGRQLMDALSEPLPSGEYPTPTEVREARARCAEILNARVPKLTCSRCSEPVHTTHDHLAIGEYGERWTCTP
jgi:hypothetical protein